MIKKASFTGILILTTLFLISCEKDFTEVGSNIIKNSKFTTKELIFNVELTQKNIDFVQAGNTEKTLSKYWLGIYNKPNAKTLKAGVVSQIILPTSLEDKTSLEDGESLSEPNLDEVILKIPLKSTLVEKESRTITNDKGEQVTVKVPKFTIDEILGNTGTNFSINVYRNGTYLNEFNPKDPSKKKSYYSNNTYTKVGSKLNSEAVYSFENIEKDTVFAFNRTLSDGSTYQSELKVPNGTNITANPFLVIKLNKEYLKSEVFDRYDSADLASQDAFKNYFRGIIIEVEGEDGSMVPLSLSSSTLKASIDFLYTRTIIKNGNPAKDKEGKIKKVEGNHSFYFGGVIASTYTMGLQKYLNNNIILQGTAGSLASIKILDQDTNQNGIPDISELKDVIINDAKLIFDINTAVDTTNIAKELFLFKKELKDGIYQKLQISRQNSILNFSRGTLELEDKKPNRYSFRVREHIKKIISGDSNNPELILRVFNENDYNDVDIITEYNWNPKSTVLLSNSTENGTKRGVKLKISYTEKNNE